MQCMLLLNVRLAIPLSFVGLFGCSSAQPPTQSNTVEVPFQITTVYALEQKGNADLTARARYYDALQTLDVYGNAGTIALSPGDAAFADGQHLSVETRTQTLGALRVDYSHTITPGKPSYLFELRRPKETISATIPAPEAFSGTVTETSPGSVKIDWAPVSKNAKVSILLIAKNGCALFDKGAIANNMMDGGTYTWEASTFRSKTQDCDFEIQIERRTQTTAASKWKKGTTELPANIVNVELVRTELIPFRLTKSSI